MTNAEQIMQKNAFIKAEMDKSFSKAQSNELWNTATLKLDAILKQYESLPKGVHMHTDSRIFPSAAVYLTVKPVIGAQKAYAILESAAIQNCAGIAVKLEKLMLFRECGPVYTDLGSADQKDFRLKLRIQKHILSEGKGCVCTICKPCYS